MNTPGYHHLQLSILVLQQTLKNVLPDEPNALLSRSANYYAFFELGPEELIKRAREATEGGSVLGYSFEQGKKVIELFYSEAEGSERRDVAVQAKRAREARVLELSEWLY
jgi:exocyst complex component 4